MSFSDSSSPRQGHQAASGDPKKPSYPEVIPALASDFAGASPDKPLGGDKSEIGGRKGPDPTRYGDWEIGGKCVDF